MTTFVPKHFEKHGFKEKTLNLFLSIALGIERDKESDDAQVDDDRAGNDNDEDVEGRFSFEDQLVMDLLEGAIERREEALVDHSLRLRRHRHHLPFAVLLCECVHKIIRLPIDTFLNV